MPQSAAATNAVTPPSRRSAPLRPTESLAAATESAAAPPPAPPPSAARARVCLCTQPILLAVLFEVLCAQQALRSSADEAAATAAATTATAAGSFPSSYSFSARSSTNGNSNINFIYDSILFDVSIFSKCHFRWGSPPLRLSLGLSVGAVGNGEGGSDLIWPDLFAPNGNVSALALAAAFYPKLHCRGCLKSIL